ncbi:hypothetical protein CANARDRAFT_27193 [[Candida] arabinofermentans NRRL YB-2248]|uniref:Eukaryotic translation initiation factor 3 subunit I n=1 Tax=[Candida] arabinofermentans NRRL YB-2248 TaxID=983967 RepID=A0A1E4T4Y4_9ASCO|nr:hypothetical protein CANARDRAFT_27193 [[Candida] arabinofermentans NRRL YB-2248]
MMRPIMLKGHGRPLTQVKFNREGDILISVAKDSEASVWYSSNGERLGTLNGHSGAIWSLDISPETDLVVTGSADFTARLWKTMTGECIHKWDQDAPVKRVEFSPDGSKILIVTEQAMGQKGKIFVYDIDYTKNEQSTTPILEIVNEDSSAEKFSVAGWSYGGFYIIAGHASGKISKYDAKTGELLNSVQGHEQLITDVQFASDRSYFITSSKDQTANMYSVDTFDQLKHYSADVPLNTACITPVKEFVILGGGQDARNVTTTAASEGKFEARFYHKIFEEEIGRVKGHFGPLNYVAIHPKGLCFASGGEDGFVRLHHFHKSYFDFLYDVEKTALATQHSTIDA